MFSQTSAAFLGFFAALAWNDAIKELIQYAFPPATDTLKAKFIYDPGIVTVAFVPIITYLDRIGSSQAGNLASVQNKTKMANHSTGTVSKYAAPHRDRWHYLDYRDGKHDGQYAEWKYLNFIEGDTAGYLMYYVMDPELKTSLGSGRLMARILRGKDFHGGVTKIPMDRIEFDTQTASVRMGDAHLNEKTPHDYAISGAVANVSWNLDYKQSTPTLDGFNDTNFGILPWEKTNWMVKMPRARVTGTISIDGTPIQLNALGYSDTNWGEFFPFTSRWEWAQFNDDKISVVFGAIYRWGRLYKTYAYAEINQEVIDFEDAKLTMPERAWDTEPKTGLKLPMQTTLEMKRGPHTLAFTYAPIQMDFISLKLYSFLPKPGVAEQISFFKGSLKHNGNIVHSFSGLGFSEYSMRMWEDTPVTF